MSRIVSFLRVTPAKFILSIFLFLLLPGIVTVCVEYVDGGGCFPELIPFGGLTLLIAPYSVNRFLPFYFSLAIYLVLSYMLASTLISLKRKWMHKNHIE